MTYEKNRLSANKEILALQLAITTGEQLTAEQEDLQDKISCSRGFWHGLFEGQLIDPEDFYEGESLESVQEAMKVLAEFSSAWETIKADL